ncbi:hypothetical protein GCM10023174_13650 [Chelativorans composti]
MPAVRGMRERFAREARQDYPGKQEKQQVRQSGRHPALLSEFHAIGKGRTPGRKDETCRLKTACVPGKKTWAGRAKDLGSDCPGTARRRISCLKQSLW